MKECQQQQRPIAATDGRWSGHTARSYVVTLESNNNGWMINRCLARAPTTIIGHNILCPVTKVRTYAVQHDAVDTVGPGFKYSSTHLYLISIHIAFSAFVPIPRLSPNHLFPPTPNIDRWDGTTAHPGSPHFLRPPKYQ